MTSLVPNLCHPNDPEADLDVGRQQMMELRMKKTG
jgi:hypothetical protein